MHEEKTVAAKTGTLLALGVTLLWLGGCYPPSALELDYGNSVRNNIAQQVVNPRAALDTTPPVGLPPQAAAEVMKGYDKSFSPEEQKAKSQALKTTISNN
jgi:hypothetical protein